jgi:two-component system CheB/CheR fusion protein
MCHARILVAEDCKDTALSLTFLLRHWGHEACAVHNGTDALEAAAEFAPNVAIVDIGLPQIDGFAVGAALRERYPPEALLLVALTGYTQPEFRARSLEAGFDHYLIKPVDPDVLKALLAHCGPGSLYRRLEKDASRC